MHARTRHDDQRTWAGDDSPEFREKYGFLPDCEVDFVERDGVLQRVRRAKGRRRAIELPYKARALPKSADDLMELLRG